MAIAFLGEPDSRPGIMEARFVIADNRAKISVCIVGKADVLRALLLNLLIFRFE